MKKIIVFVLSFSLLFCTPMSVCAGQMLVNDENIKAKSVVLLDMDSREVLYAKNENEELSPASVTKIMSILLILEAIDSGKIKLNDMVAASENAVSMGGSQIWLEVGEEMSVDDLLKAVIISSANDACTLLGEYVAGSSSAFVDMMNKKAKELGLKDTNFENCTGLDDDVTNHYSSAYDLAVIACEVMKYDLVTKYSTVWLDSLRNGETELNNTNKLVNTYNGITGLKTGTTSNAGFCLCATATRDGMSLVSVVLGSDSSEDRFNLSTQLLDYGFANYRLEKLTVDKSKLKTVKVKKGTVKSIMPAVPEQQNVLTEKASGEVICKYNIKKEINAPVKSGDKLGEIVYYSDSKKIASVALTADKNVGKVSFSYIFSYLIKYI